MTAKGPERPETDVHPDASDDSVPQRPPTIGMQPNAAAAPWWTEEEDAGESGDAAQTPAAAAPVEPTPAESAQPVREQEPTDDPPEAPAPRVLVRRGDPAAPARAQPPEERRPTAAAFTPEAMLRPSQRVPEKGWRRAVHHLTGGLWTPAPSQAEIERQELVARVKQPVRGSRRIAVISRKGGVGKTTTTLMLGHTFAAYRGDRIIALDGNPDAGSLGYRVRRQTSATITDLLDGAATTDRYADIRSYTSQAPTRLEIIAADDDPHITQAIGEDEYRTAVELLERHYNLILLDTGTGVLHSATRGILDAADQLVLVLVPSLDGARAASLTLDWLEQQGRSDLVVGSVAVLNQSRDRGLVDIERVESHFQERCRATVRVPWDPHLVAGAESSLEQLRPVTRDVYLRLAAAVADGFHLPSRRDEGLVGQ